MFLQYISIQFRRGMLIQIGNGTNILVRKINALLQEQQTFILKTARTLTFAKSTFGKALRVQTMQML